MAIKYTKSSSNIVRNNAGKIVGFGTPVKSSGGGDYVGGSAGNVNNGNIAVAEAQAKARLEEERRLAAEKVVKEKQAAKQIVLSAEVQKKINLENQNRINQQFMKVTEVSKPIILPPIQTQPYIEARQTGVYRDTTTGRNIPTREFVYVDPTVMGKQAERTATSEEINLYKQDEKSLSLASGTASVNKTNPAISNLKGGIINSYNELNTALYQTYTSKLPSGEAVRRSVKQAVLTPVAVLSGNMNVVNAQEPVSSFIAGATTSIYEDIKYNPLKQVLLYGTGRVAGLAVTGVGRGLSMFPKVGAGLGKTFRVTEFGAGVYLGGAYVMQTANQIYNSPDATSKGEIFGSSLKDAALVGAGYSKGKLDFAKLQGGIGSLGRTNIPQKEIIPADVLSGKKRFVENPTGRINAKEYKILFETKSKVIPGINEPMAYHQAPSTFWNKGSLEVTTPGSSEFPGLYGAYLPSPHFLKVGTGSSSFKAIFSNPEKFLKQLWQPYGKPGTAAIIPTKFVIGKSSKLGQAFIPAVKPEVEAIFPVGTKAVGINRGYYYTWEGVKIPIDVFRATGERGTGTTMKSLFGGSSYSNKIISDAKLFSAPQSSKTSLTSNKVSIKSYVSSPTSVISSISPTSSGTSSSGRRSSGGGSSSSKSYPPSSSVISLISPSSSTGSSKTSKISYSPSYRSRGSSSVSSLFRSIKKNKTIFGLQQRGTPKQPSIKSFNVFMRRYGKFKSIGNTSSLKQAFGIGTMKARTTLGATFKIGGLQKGLRTPKGFYSKVSKKGETLYIQKRKYRLGTFGEKLEIKQAKKLKR